MITGSLIKKMRIDAGLTQKRLAEIAGVSQAHVAKIEQGNVDPRLSTVNRIMRVLTEGKQKKCGDIMTKGVLFAKPNDNILKISDAMMRHAISQMPLISGSKIIGTITEETIIKNLRSNLAEERAKNVMEKALPIVQEETSIDIVRSLLEKNQGVLVAKGKEILGIITRSDLLKTIG
ncbi:CBS domain-containing protein [Candidatus Bathyarchaeota archaeon]|jgi:predicted transcriptional regulator|nr:CBS domain-containing protein [Candidatus Bathyarchaeota archaeon]